MTVAKLVGAFTGDSDPCPVAGLDLALIAWATSFAFQTTEQFQNATWWRDQAELARLRAEIADRKSRELLQATPGLGDDGDPYLQSAEPWNDPFVRRNP
jgi:hypothetical protein